MKIIILLIMFTNSLYSQMVVYTSNGYSVAENVDKGWRKPVLLKTNITIDNEKINFGTSKNEEIYTIKSINPEILEDGDKTTIYNCVDDENKNLEIRFIEIYSAPKKKTTKMMNLSYINYMVSYILIETKPYENSINYGIQKDFKKDYKGAILDYTKAIELKPNNIVAYIHRANSQSDAGNENEAILDYNKVIAFNPKLEDAYFNRACSKANKDDYKGAILDLTKTIELNPKNADAHYYIGLIKINNLNEKQSACLFLEKAIKLGAIKAIELKKENCK